MNEGGGEGLFYSVLLFLALAVGLAILAIGVVKKRKSATIIGGALVAIPTVFIAVVLLVNGAVLFINATADKPPTTTVTAPASSKSTPRPTTNTTQLPPSSVSTAPSTPWSTITTVLVPAKDTFLGWLRLDVTPRAGVRVAVGRLREIASGEVGSRQRLIEGEIIIANKSSTPFAYRPEDFRLSVGPFQFQVQGMTASTQFPVSDAVLTPVKVGAHPLLDAGEVDPGKTLHGYLLTFVADKGTCTSGLNYNSSDPASAGKAWGARVQP
jgi:hypothetical protein